jgi:hypothetical protein
MIPRAVVGDGEGEGDGEGVGEGCVHGAPTGARQISFEGLLSIVFFNAVTAK